MAPESMQTGMAVVVDLIEGIRGAVIVRPLTSGHAAECCDVRLPDGECRMVHWSRVQPADVGRAGLPNISNKAAESFKRGTCVKPRIGPPFGASQTAQEDEL